MLEQLPLFSYPFDISILPTNGIYFFYEKGETGIHFGSKPRIVRVGTHRDGNFKSRIAEHFLLKERKMQFTVDQPPPHDRSIFRKHIGRALLNKAADPYLAVWELDFTTRKGRIENRHLRDIAKESEIERDVTRILRQSFSFRFIEIPDQAQRMGAEGLESALIGTLASCDQCGGSSQWLGNHSPKLQIRESGLWLVQHLKSKPLSAVQLETIRLAINRERQQLTTVFIPAD
ncbi:MAG: hypothetical protein WBQ76_01370 [Candidatus Korobacteraceae bacterium]